MELRINIKEAIEKFKERRELLKSGVKFNIKTKYPNINAAIANGFLKNTINTIAAHSGTGKTALTIQLGLSMLELNKNFRMLFFTLEMPSESVVARMVSQRIKRTVVDLNIDTSFDVDKEVYEDLNNYDIDFEEYGGNPQKIRSKISKYVNEYPDQEIVIMIDHSLLIEGSSESEKISELARVLNECKKEFKNTTYFILSQLNDAMLESTRLSKKSQSYPMYTDLMYGRQLYQISDTVIVIVIPAKYHEEKDTYGYKQLPLYYYPANSKNIRYRYVYMHIIKGRDTGDSNRILVFVDNLHINELVSTNVDQLNPSKK